MKPKKSAAKRGSESSNNGSDSDTTMQHNTEDLEKLASELAAGQTILVDLT